MPRNPAAPAGVTIINEIVAFVRRFVVLTPVQADAIALWIAHSHAIDAADCTPYLAVTSAEKRSGKTRTFDVLELLVARPWRAITPTEAVTFRKIEKDQPTLLLDEIDTIFGDRSRDHEPLRALLNAGNQRGTQVPRCVGPSQQLVSFNVFCAKALAGIGQLPDTIADRAVTIRVKRKAPDESAERFRRREVEAEAGELRERLASWAAPIVDGLAAARPTIPPELDDRAADGWEPLLAIADAAGADWPERAREAALKLSAQPVDDESIGIRLLWDINRVLAERAVDRIATSDLIQNLAADEEAPWADWRGGGRISPRALSNLLRRYEIRSRSIRLADGETPKGFLREQFEDAWRRFPPEIPPENATTPQPAWLSGNGAFPIRHTDGPVADEKGAANPHGSVDVAVWRKETPHHDLDHLRRVLKAHRPELVAGKDATTPIERRAIAESLALYEEFGIIERRAAT